MNLQMCFAALRVKKKKKILFAFKLIAEAQSPVQLLVSARLLGKGFGDLKKKNVSRHWRALRTFTVKVHNWRLYDVDAARTDVEIRRT